MSNPAYWLDIVAILIAVGALTVSYFTHRQSLVESLRPVVVVVYDIKSGWTLRNIGRGPALDILLAEPGQENTWSEPTRITPLPAGGEFHLEWLCRVNITKLETTYKDVQGKKYLSTCFNDLTDINKIRNLPTWSKGRVRAYWDRKRIHSDDRRPPRAGIT